MNRSIADLVPHAGRMVLLDELVDVDSEGIHCRARTGVPADHPLALDGRLPAEALAEYGAQAIAVHGGLLGDADAAPRPGRLVALGRLALSVSGLDQDTELNVTAQRLAGDEDGQIYDFRVEDAQRRLLAEGRATIMFAREEDSE
ncbi:hypothetical protein [Wenzhouxiangella marina]|uniref:Putative 3-hydroxylacyl-(Acyl carrier protein) dehydratase n=1 Tax=Wenzhouxiangella marina TaxID=1579979 RepID=A0A0K0Y0B9_9GAMM|nr:hypothetical protein [Wenzhouxiangella marina]AKS43365.1 Putative 3-hydroxylacyl-(Acyl carrier protein) dehydratase [Wenzhouxiangella marina]MBB6088519.1 putative hotdog family 3-hydroxylacyl-ACP dehydratase [Wenzhouxiangella marina]